jgi:hypothetical protein
VVELVDVGLVTEEELAKDVDEVDVLNCDEVDVTLPVPTHSARSASPVRLANSPASQSAPSQGFQACRWASVRLCEREKMSESVKVEQVTNPAS